MVNKILFGLVFFGSFFCLPISIANARTVDFSDYNWQVKSGLNGPGPNYWNDSTEGVLVDEIGKLHLIVNKIGNQWKSSEIYLNKSLGYGVYEFIIESNISTIDKNLIAAPFLYADDEHELDIEFTRWGVEDDDNLEYSVQPTTNAAITNSKTILLPNINTETLHKIEWSPDYIRFSAYNGDNKIAEWEYKGKDNFVPGDERVHINFWQLKGKAPSSGKKEEVIFKSFIFKPLDTQPIQNSSSTVDVPSSKKYTFSSPVVIETKSIADNSTLLLNVEKETSANDEVKTIHEDIPTIVISPSFVTGSKEEKMDLVFKKDGNYEEKLIKYINSSKVYKIENNKKHWIVNEKTFNYYNFNWNDISIIEEYFEDGDSIEILNNNFGFNRDLKLGMTGEDVRELQRYLNNHGFILVDKGIGSLGNETNYFGSLTQEALIRFQKANNINPALGYFGSLTRAFMNK